MSQNGFVAGLAVAAIMRLGSLGAQTALTPRVDYAGLIGRSDIVLARPNLEPAQAMPLGNGRLGVAVWAADGFTAQLNRVDTLPDRLPVARVTVAGLAALTSAKDYVGRLDLYNATLREQGSGMSATIYVDVTSDTLVIDVTGADPKVVQTVNLSLAAPRRPLAATSGATAILSETWTDDTQPGASGRNFGSLAAVTADGQDLTARVEDAFTAGIAFRANADGHFRILVAAPQFSADSGSAPAFTARTLVKVSKGEPNREWWHAFWHRAGYFRITSADGAGEYMETLRALYLYSSASSSASEYPGSQAGVADMFSTVPTHNWSPGAFWHWNLRMQVAANLSAGTPELNLPYFNLYRENLTNMEKWTRAHMDGLPGICIPETMRFNGRGIEYENWGKDSPGIALNCDSRYPPYYNARTISTGAEVSLWIWQQYLMTADRAFLAKNFPVMAESARFLLAYEAPGKDGLLHTSRSNAHETQWDTEDPTTDLSAREALYNATIKAAQTLGTEALLIPKLEAALAKIPPLPRTEMDTPKTLLGPSADAEAKDVIGASYRPAAGNSNVENIGLEPVWPYDLIGDTSPLFELARRTYVHRPYPTNQDWSFDPIQAARLQYPEEVRATLIKLTETYQQFVNGFANWGGKTGEFYIEQQAIVAAGLQEALVQDYDGILRVNPAFPKEWNVDVQVAVRGRTKVDVGIHSGVVDRVVIEARTTGRLRIRNPWGSGEVEVTAPRQPKVKLSGGTLELSAIAGRSYSLFPTGGLATKASTDEITGVPATLARKLGPVQIGIFP